MAQSLTTKSKRILQSPKKAGYVSSSRTKLMWVALLYFAEGFPFGLLFDAFPVYFRTHGMSLTEIGLLSVVGLPWTLKFLWAPLVDVLGSRRSWIVTCQGLLALDLGLLLFLDPTNIGSLAWGGLIALAILSATQDIAIDAYTIELLDQTEMGPANGIRVSTYRVALIVAGGMFVGAAGLVGWQPAFLTAAVLLAVLALLSSHMPRTAQGLQGRPVTQSWPSALTRGFLKPLTSLWRRPGVIAVLLFVLLFKLGDMAGADGPAVLGGPGVYPTSDRHDSGNGWSCQYDPRCVARRSSDKTMGAFSRIVGIGHCSSRFQPVLRRDRRPPPFRATDVLRFDCRVVLWRTGDRAILGLFDEYL